MLHKAVKYLYFNKNRTLSSRRSYDPWWSIGHVISAGQASLPAGQPMRVDLRPKNLYVAMSPCNQCCGSDHATCAVALVYNGMLEGEQYPMFLNFSQWPQCSILSSGSVFEYLIHKFEENWEETIVSNPTTDFLWDSSQVTVMVIIESSRISPGKPNLDTIWDMLEIIVLLEGPMTPMLCLPYMTFLLRISQSFVVEKPEFWFPVMNSPPEVFQPPESMWWTAGIIHPVGWLPLLVRT